MKKRSIGMLLAGMLTASVIMGGCGSATEGQKEVVDQEEKQDDAEDKTETTENKDDSNKSTEEESESQTENTADGAKEESGKVEENTASEDKKSEPITVSVADGYDNAGFTMFECEETGTYEFLTEDPNETGVEWEVYLLDEEFDDAVRYIPQAYEDALKGERFLEIKEGQYVYVYCSENGFTEGNADDKATLSFSIVREN